MDSTQLERVFKALDSLNRIRILRHLTGRMASVNDIAVALKIPTSTAAIHVETLEEAGLIEVDFEPASRGLRKICARLYDQIVIDLPMNDDPLILRAAAHRGPVALVSSRLCRVSLP